MWIFIIVYQIITYIDVLNKLQVWWTEWYSNDVQMAEYSVLTEALFLQGNWMKTEFMHINTLRFTLTLDFEILSLNDFSYKSIVQFFRA